MKIRITRSKLEVHGDLMPSPLHTGQFESRTHVYEVLKSAKETAHSNEKLSPFSDVDRRIYIEFPLVIM